ncbi:MAG TPA: DUF1236 domain-containing protein [Bradyrhizobium sp.]|nr:DUF1236 domain-containing protein [Bradyrhizobium sp.]
MINRLMISAAAVALIAGTGFANAQGTGMGREGASVGSTAQQSAPSTDRGNSAAPANRDAKESTGPSSGMKATQSEKSPTAGKNQRADENLQGQKSKSMSSDNERAKDNLKGGSKEMKAEGREDRNGMKAEGREERGGMKAEGREERNGNMKAEGREDRKGNMNAETKGSETRTQTTVGQAGAGAKLSTEQRTRITTIIREQHVQPQANVTFEIRPGVRITRDRVSLRPLPSDVVTIYPEWRGYEFFLVNNRIVVVDPRTLEIVDVIDV